jgi:hypothetical protein
MSSSWKSFRCSPNRYCICELFLLCVGVFVRIVIRRFFSSSSFFFLSSFFLPSSFRSSVFLPSSSTRSHLHTFTHSHYPTHTLSLSVSPYVLSPTHSLTFTHSLSLSHPLTHSRTHTLSLFSHHTTHNQFDTTFSHVYYDWMARKRAEYLSSMLRDAKPIQSETAKWHSFLASETISAPLQQIVSETESRIAHRTHHLPMAIGGWYSLGVGVSMCVCVFLLITCPWFSAIVIHVVCVSCFFSSLLLCMLCVLTALTARRCICALVTVLLSVSALLSPTSHLLVCVCVCV